MNGEMSSMDESVTCGWRPRMTDMDGAKVTSSTTSKFSDGDGSLKFFLTLIIFPYDRFPPPFVLYHFFCCWYEAFFLSTMYAIEKSSRLTFRLFAVQIFAMEAGAYISLFAP